MKMLKIKIQTLIESLTNKTNFSNHILIYYNNKGKGK